MESSAQLYINDDSWMEVCNFSDGTFDPLDGFMGSADYHSVLDSMCLLNGVVWTIPITLEVPYEQKEELLKSKVVSLIDSKQEVVAELEIQEIFHVDLEKSVQKIFGTSDKRHPGVAKELQRSPYRVAGKISLLKKPNYVNNENFLSPSETKALFKERGWKTIAGFQTRNPIHRAHEYLQRVALEVTDGIFVQPLIGWKKPGDFTPEAVVQAYKTQFEHFHPQQNAIFGTLHTPMRYAGPREAVFHAIIRKNYGCTHFIVGRDHAGVMDFYGKYEAQELCQSFSNLGIEILALKGPFYCSKCNLIVTEQTCAHQAPHTSPISGTNIREMLQKEMVPDPTHMRPEIAEVLIELQKQDSLFIREK